MRLQASGFAAVVSTILILSSQVTPSPKSIDINIKILSQASNELSFKLTLYDDYDYNGTNKAIIMQARKCTNIVSRGNREDGSYGAISTRSIRLQGEVEAHCVLYKNVDCKATDNVADVAGNVECFDNLPPIKSAMCSEIPQSEMASVSYETLSQELANPIALTLYEYWGSTGRGKTFSIEPEKCTSIKWMARKKDQFGNEFGEPVATDPHSLEVDGSANCTLFHDADCSGENASVEGKVDSLNDLWKSSDPPLSAKCSGAPSCLMGLTSTSELAVGSVAVGPEYSTLVTLYNDFNYTGDYSVSYPIPFEACTEMHFQPLVKSLKLLHEKELEVAVECSLYSQAGCEGMVFKVTKDIKKLSRQGGLVVASGKCAKNEGKEGL